ncbi:MAG: DUF3883 domain-containing protein, partial [Candidatus Omnitrophica bacterium]|nr:DUF3883 domain-containing protein [Candidatus Omnitrophota bacterium]
LDNPYAGLLVEARLVKSKEKGGAVREVWFYDKEGKLTEKKKFIWVEDKQGNILTSFYKFPRELKLKDGFVFVPENRAGIVPLPEEPIKVYKVKETDLLKIELKDGEIEKVQFQEKPGGPWIMAQWRKYLGKTISYRINGDGTLSITSISGRGNVNLSPLKPIELSLNGISGSNTEEKAMQLTERYEESQKREAIRVEKVNEYGPIGYDILSHTQKGISPFEERKIEVKGSTLEDGPIGWTGNEIGTAEVEGKLYYLYIVVINSDKARLYIIQDPFNLLKPYENGG